MWEGDSQFQVEPDEIFGLASRLKVIR